MKGKDSLCGEHPPEGTGSPEKVLLGDGRPRPSRRARRGEVFAALIQIGQTLRAALQEIFDESAYQRFLERAQRESSVAAYAEFRRTHERANQRRPRCC